MSVPIRPPMTRNLQQLAALGRQGTNPKRFALLLNAPAEIPFENPTLILPKHYPTEEGIISFLVICEEARTKDKMGPSEVKLGVTPAGVDVLFTHLRHRLFRPYRTVGTHMLFPRENTIRLAVSVKSTMSSSFWLPLHHLRSWSPWRRFFFKR